MSFQDSIKALPYICISLACMPITAWGQNTAANTTEGQFTFTTDKPFKLLEIEEKEDPIPKKKKKPKRKVFYGIKTRKGFTRKGYKGREVIEKFYYLKIPDQPSRFVRDIYWYDFFRGEIRKTRKFDPEIGALLHGPYRKTMGKKLLEEGVFYKGTKHARWMKYGRQNLLEEKKKYYKGWPKESLITYHDPVEQTQVKEIIPMEHGEREGYYYQFHKNGVVAVFGNYRWNHRVGKWIESYPNGKQKKIIMYPENPFTHSWTPFIKAEWTAKGEKIYTSKKRQ